MTSLHIPPTGPELDAEISRKFMADEMIRPYSSDYTLLKRVREEIESRGYSIYFGENVFVTCTLLRPGHDSVFAWGMTEGEAVGHAAHCPGLAHRF